MPSSPEITLYVDTPLMSPYAMSVFVALTEKELPFGMQRIDLEAGEHRRGPFRELSITGRVPMIEHNGVHLCESSAIAEYLDDIFPAPRWHAILPRHPVARAAARQVQAWLRSDLLALRLERPTSVVFLAPTSRPLSDAGRAAAEKLFEGARRLIGDPAAQLFDDWCLADTELALMLQRLVMNGDEVPNALAQYARAQWQRPSVQAWMALERRSYVSWPAVASAR